VSTSQHLGTEESSATVTRRSKGNAKKFGGMSWHNFKCSTCNHDFDDIVDHGKDETPGEGKACEAEGCDGHADWVPMAKIDRFSETFPYFDRGLGMMVNSKQHRREICKNPKKYGINATELTPVDGDWDVDKEMGGYWRAEEELLKDYDEYADKLENDPAFASFREARDQGRI
jgi:hypothetical protein